MLVVVGSLCACGGAAEQQLGEFVAPDGDYRVRATLTAGWLPRAPYVLRLYLLPRGEVQPTAVVETELATDGAPFSAAQIGFKWVAERVVMLCVKPLAVAAHGLRIELTEPPHVEPVPRC